MSLESTQTRGIPMRLKPLLIIIRDLIKKIKDDHVSAFSAQAAFFIIISFFPFIMFLLTLLQYLPIEQSTLMASITSIMPLKVKSLIIVIIDEIYSNASGTIISVTAITALWSASRGFLSIVKGLNAVYGIKETRNYFKLRIISTLYTLVFTILIIVTLVILVFGNRLYLWIEAKLPLFNNVALLIISIRTIVSLVLLVFFFLLLFIVIPNRKAHPLSELPGALLSAAGWMGFSYLYSFYIDNMGSFSQTYGSLTAIVFLMLWLYFCMQIMFMGSELNVFLSTTKIPKLFHFKKK